MPKETDRNTEQSRESRRMDRNEDRRQYPSRFAEETDEERCPACDVEVRWTGGHLRTCAQFMNFNAEDCTKLLKRNRLCCQCFESGHSAGTSECRITTWKCDQCNTFHNSTIRCPPKVTVFRSRVTMAEEFNLGNKDEDFKPQTTAPLEIERAMQIVQENLTSMVDNILAAVNKCINDAKENSHQVKKEQSTNVRTTKAPVQTSTNDSSTKVSRTNRNQGQSHAKLDHSPTIKNDFQKQKELEPSIPAVDYSSPPPKTHVEYPRYNCQPTVQQPAPIPFQSQPFQQQQYPYDPMIGLNPYAMQYSPQPYEFGGWGVTMS